MMTVAATATMTMVKVRMAEKTVTTMMMEKAILAIHKESSGNQAMPLQSNVDLKKRSYWWDRQEVGNLG